jgi:hypothetical protein
MPIGVRKKLMPAASNGIHAKKLCLRLRLSRSRTNDILAFNLDFLIPQLAHQRQKLGVRELGARVVAYAVEEMAGGARESVGVVTLEIGVLAGIIDQIGADWCLVRDLGLL